MGACCSSPDSQATRESKRAAVKKGGFAVHHAPAELLVGSELGIAALKQHGYALGLLPAEMRANREVVLAAVKQNGGALRYASPELRPPTEAAFAAVRQNGALLRLHRSSSGLTADRDIVITAVAQDGYALEHAAPKLKADRDIVLTAVKQNGLALQYASTELQNDREVVLAAVQQDGGALYYASAELQDDRATVFAAVQQDGQSLHYASERRHAEYRQWHHTRYHCWGREWQHTEPGLGLALLQLSLCSLLHPRLSTGAPAGLVANVVELIGSAVSRAFSVCRARSGQTTPVWSAGFSSDCTKLISASDDWTVRVWGEATGESQHRQTVTAAVQQSVQSVHCASAGRQAECQANPAEFEARAKEEAAAPAAPKIAVTVTELTGAVHTALVRPADTVATLEKLVCQAKDTSAAQARFMPNGSQPTDGQRTVDSYGVDGGSELQAVPTAQQVMPAEEAVPPQC